MNVFTQRRIILLVIFLILIIIGIGIEAYLKKDNQNLKIATPVDMPTESSALSATPNNNIAAGEFKPLIDRWSERVTKKPFGIKISPDNSPVQPERFSGYHTGVDFETLPEEQGKDVPVYAICAGRILLKEWISGYGGLVVQSCELAKQDITVVYGHLNLASVGTAKNQLMSAEEKIGNLGKGFSPETDGERKHLHLGIHRGRNINILGYVQNSSELVNWIDITKYLK